MADEIRRKRVGDEIRRVLANVCQNGSIRNLPLLTNCTEVEMNRDLTYARCMMSIPGTPAVKAATLERLNKLKGYLRHEIVSRIKLRQAPDLRFYLDDSLERGMLIDEKIRAIAAERASREAAATGSSDADEAAQEAATEDLEQ